MINISISITTTQLIGIFIGSVIGCYLGNLLWDKWHGW